MQGLTAVAGTTTIIDIHVELLPEGVFLGTSPDLPGLTVEAASRDEIIEVGRAVALDLLDPQRIRPAGAFRFRFIELAH